MSLISDALKTAQRERTGRAQSGKDPQPLIDGFFPYVSSSPTRSRSRLIPMLGISAGVVVLLGVAAYVALPTLKQSRNGGPRVTLPPAGPVAQRPTVTDTAAVVAAIRDSVTQPVVEAAPVETPSVPAQRPLRASDSRVAVRAADVGSARRDTSVSAAAAVVPRSPAAVSRTDHELEATTLFNAGDLQGAREKFELATRFAPTARAWTNYGVTLQRLGNLSGAAAAYQAAIGIDANYLEAWLYQGRLAIDLNDVARAIPLLERARAINPRNAEVNIELARLQSDAKNWTEVKRFAEEAVRVDPSNYRGQWYLATAADQLKDVEMAIRAYSAYLQSVGGSERDQAPFVGYARERLTLLRGKP